MTDDPEALLALAEEAIARVRELHRQREAISPLTELNVQVCANCLVEYPCRTIQALDGEQ